LTGSRLTLNVPSLVALVWETLIEYVRLAMTKASTYSMKACAIASARKDFISMLTIRRAVLVLRLVPSVMTLKLALFVIQVPNSSTMCALRNCHSPISCLS